MRGIKLCVALGWILLAGCGGTQSEPTPVDKCSAPNGLTLTTIESVTDWINAMPKPLELPCFLASLPRPLAVNLTQSAFSVQPANGRRNPRIFIFVDALTLSVVPQEAPKADGTASPHLLEMSFRTEGIQSVKAELVFPVRQHLPYSAAYTRLQQAEETTVCGVCHAGETLVNMFDGVPVHESQMLAPYADAAVSLGFLINENTFCNAEVEPHRCAMLQAIVGGGDIAWQAFADEVPEL